LTPLCLRNDLPFTSELNSIARQHVLAALEEIGNPEARRALVEVARRPPVARSSSAMERREVNDERLQAIRALRKFKDPDTVQALVEVLEREKDIAVRHRANETLQTITGKNPGPDAQAWRQALYSQPSNATVREPSAIERMMWWKNQ